MSSAGFVASGGVVSSNDEEDFLSQEILSETDGLKSSVSMDDPERSKKASNIKLTREATRRFDEAENLASEYAKVQKKVEFHID